jgi:hypothetical protein
VVLRRARLLFVLLLAVGVPACWSLASDETGQCNGYGGDEGFGGEGGVGGGGFGGSDVGTGIGGSDVGTGIGGSDVGVASSSADVSGAGPSSGAGGGSARPVPHRLRRGRQRRPRGHLKCPSSSGSPTSCPITNWGPTDGTTYDYCDSACVAMCGSGLAVGTFSASIFKFATTLPDDGQDAGGGWQVANVTLDFDRWTGILPESWTCDVAVGMPLRTKAYGVISAAFAAVASADVANQATSYLMHNPNEIPQGLFCAQLPGAMNAMFAADAVYKNLGARVTKQGMQ